MREENIKLLDYVESCLGKREEYLKVSEIGQVMTILLGTNLNVTGEKINWMLLDEDIQDFTEEDEYFSYIPKKKDIPYKKVINKEKEYGIIKWHYSIIAKLLDIDFNLSIKRNITRIKKKLKKNRAIFINYEIDEDILEEELSEILEI